MKIFAISDLHGRLEGLDPRGVDLVLVAGDFAPMHGWSAGDIDYQVCWINAALSDWISGYPNTQFRLIPGNHDLFAQDGDSLPDVRLPKNAKLSCGHIHTGDHNPIVLSHEDGSETVVRNVSRLDEDYEIRYEPYVFEV